MSPRDFDEASYLQGDRAAWLRMLRECLAHLGYDSPEATAHRWVLERADAVMELRTVCRDHGDNEWADRLHLADVIEKHLARHLDAR